MMHRSRKTRSSSEPSQGHNARRDNARAVFRSLLLLIVAGSLAACAAHQVRESAEDQLRAGSYEQALQTVQRGLERYPDDPELLTELRTIREQAGQHLVAAASAARAARDFDQADTIVRRLLALDPRNEPGSRLLADIARDRRHQAVIAQAEEDVKKGDRVAALSKIRAALLESPSDPDLLALSRQLQMQLRHEETIGGVRLAETRPVELEFRDANLRMVLEAMSRETHVNFTVDKDVRPDLKVSVFLRGASVENALDLILGTNQLNKKIVDSSTVIVYPNTPEKNREYQDLIVRSYFLANADVKQTAALLRAVLKIKEPFVDDKLNLLVIREPPEIIELADRLIAMYDQQEPEVMLEVEVLEVRSSRVTDLGILYPDTFSLTPMPPANASGLTLSNFSLATNRLGLGISGFVANLQREVDDVKILANPRIRAKNHEKAHILVGDKIPIISSSAAPTAGLVSENIQYIDVGIKLEFEPSVSLDNDVSLKINLETSTLGAQIKTSSGSVAYQIGTRTATTTLKLKDGETQVLGGLINNQSSNNSTRIPGLGDIPGVGRLFSSDLTDQEHDEVILAISPHVIRNVHRPDADLAEFFSGTEAVARAAPIRTGMDGGSQPERPKPAVALVAPDKSIEAPAKAAPRLEVALTAPAEINTGDTLEIPVQVKTGFSLRGLPIEIAYDRTRLELVDWTEGSFLKSGGVTTSASRTVDPAAGTIGIGILRNTPDGATGEGLLATLKFKAIASGNAQIRITRATPLGVDRILEAPPLPPPVSVSIK
jgi:general secretion pathway protein D